MHVKNWKDKFFFRKRYKEGGPNKESPLWKDPKSGMSPPHINRPGRVQTSKTQKNLDLDEIRVRPIEQFDKI